MPRGQCRAPTAGFHENTACSSNKGDRARGLQPSSKTFGGERQGMQSMSAERTLGHFAVREVGVSEDLGNSEKWQ